MKNNPSTLKCIAHCDEGIKITSRNLSTRQDITILISGGDFSGNEITLARKQLRP
ncbi:MAG: hypothetical protein ACLU4J_02965 [Butyricimonas paravirosa]